MMNQPARRGPGSPTNTPPGNRQNIPTPRRIPWFWVLLSVFLVINYLVGQMMLPRVNHVQVPYSVFEQQVSAGNVALITSSGDAIQGQFKNPVTWPTTGPDKTRGTYFDTRVAAFSDPALLPLLKNKGVLITPKNPEPSTPWWLNLLIGFGPTLLFFGLFFWLSRAAASQAQSGVFGLGRSKAKRFMKEQSTTTFADVAGIDEAKADLVEIVDFLRNPKKYQRLGGTIPKGVLLVGAPGTGKTLLARAVAGEAGVPFFSMAASEFVEMIVGVGASRVRDLFEQAKAAAPAIIFVDELDAIGRARGAGNFGGNDEREQTLNQILVEMDGFDSRLGVIMLAATNRQDVLDPALLRPGRFDRRIVVQRPDRAGREAILRVHTRNVPLSPDVRLDDLAAGTPGLVGAELQNLVNEAALLAARKNRDNVQMDDFWEAMDKIVLGAERKLMLSEKDRRVIAVHESGHALVANSLPDADPVRKVTIIPRGQALGVTFQLPIDDRFNYPEEYLKGRIASALAGRAAEEEVFGAITTGAENDLQVVSDLARQMVTRWGMSKAVGPLAFTRNSDEMGYLRPDLAQDKPYSDHTAEVIDQEVRRIVEEGFQTAHQILRERRDRLDALTNALLREESLDEQQVREVLGPPVSEAAGGSPLVTQRAAQRIAS
ncbi:MAG: ATP-dependent zinc metalloprotease FtsH [Chloroflexota bacterium]